MKQLGLPFDVATACAWYGNIDPSIYYFSHSHITSTSSTIQHPSLTTFEVYLINCKEGPKVSVNKINGRLLGLISRTCFFSAKPAPAGAQPVDEIEKAKAEVYAESLIESRKDLLNHLSRPGMEPGFRKINTPPAIVEVDS